MTNPLQALWRTFFDMCRYRVKPQELPYSPQFLQVLLLLYSLVNLLLAWLMQPFYLAVLSAVVQTLLLVVLTWSLLRIVGHQVRLNQTLIALVGTGLLFSLLNLPLGVWIVSVQQDDMAPVLPVFMLLLLVGWNLSVYAHILRHALSTHFFFGFLLAFTLSLLSGSILNALTGPAL